MVVTLPCAQYPRGGRHKEAFLVVDEDELEKPQKRPSGWLGSEEQEREELCSTGIRLSESEDSDYCPGRSPPFSELVPNVLSCHLHCGLGKY